MLNLAKEECFSIRFFVIDFLSPKFDDEDVNDMVDIFAQISLTNDKCAKRS